MNILAYILVLPLMFHNYSTEPKELDKWMTVQEQRQMGINKLNDDEKLMLLRWLKVSFDERLNKHGVAAFYIKSSPGEDGALELSDGSQWIINPEDNYRSKYWRIKSKVRIMNSSNLKYPFLIILDSNDDHAEAQLHSKALPSYQANSGSSNLWLFTKININGELSLSDKSLWIIAPEDRKTAAEWLLGDSIRTYNTQNQEFPYIIHNINTNQKIYCIKE